MKSQNERGVLTEKIKKYAENYLGREFTTVELRLYLYLFDRAINGGKLELKHINAKEAKILLKLQSENRFYLKDMGNKIGFFPRYDFYIFMLEILRMAYVVCLEDVEEELKDDM